MEWKILNKTKNQKPKTKNIVEILLRNRGLATKKQREEFLNPKEPEKLTPREVGISAVEAKKAVGRIKRAVKNKEKIIVYGDYDADGVCATAIMWETLYGLGAKVMPFIPPREEGYGLKIERLKELAKEGVTLVITVDQGIVAQKQVEAAKKLGIEIIVTDHHLPGKEFPKAYALVHTTKLSGAGVAWFLAQHIQNTKYLPCRQAGKIQNTLDLATLGTITDLMPLKEANRSLVCHGLEKVQQTKRVGLLALYQEAGIKPGQIGTYEIGFLIGPRLNATGRLEDPMESLRLLCTKDNARAKELAEKLNRLNRERQNLLEQTFNHAQGQASETENLLFISHQSYHEGVIGLVAGRLVEKFSRPAIVVAQGETFSKASARSVNGFNIIEAIRECREFLIDAGGHPAAAGFTLKTEKIEIVKQRLLQVAQEKLSPQLLSPSLKIDLEVNLADLDFALYQDIEKLAPFGLGNPEPVFASRKVSVVDAKTVGNDNQHLKLRVTGYGLRVSFDAIAFNLGHLLPDLSPEKPVDIAYNLLVNEWSGDKRLQLKIKDIKTNER
jgi:single-stranded-DNA-specific exonuclease